MLDCGVAAVWGLIGGEVARNKAAVPRFKMIGPPRGIAVFVHDKLLTCPKGW